MKLWISESVSDDRSKKTEHVGSSIRSMIEACGYTEKLSGQRALALWATLIESHMGAEAEQVSEAKEIRQGEMTVRVSKSAWRHRLSFEVPKVIRMINDELGEETVKSIRLT